MNYFVTAIDTDSGKTIVSAILCEALQADYWKPIQAGFPRDTETVRELVSNPKTIFHKETFFLNMAASPHAAAKAEGINIKLSDFRIPETSNSKIIVEGAGGCLVPLNDQDFVIDLPVQFNWPVVLVADLYLGSINHTLLTVEALKKRNVNIKGIIFNGSNPESERIILHHTSLPCLLKIQSEDFITPEIVKNYARAFLSKWHE